MYRYRCRNYTWYIGPIYIYMYMGRLSDMSIYFPQSMVIIHWLCTLLSHAPTAHSTAWMMWNGTPLKAAYHTPELLSTLACRWHSAWHALFSFSFPLAPREFCEPTVLHCNILVVRSSPVLDKQFRRFEFRLPPGGTWDPQFWREIKPKRICNFPASGEAPSPAGGGVGARDKPLVCSCSRTRLARFAPPARFARTDTLSASAIVFVCFQMTNTHPHRYPQGDVRRTLRRRNFVELDII